MKFLIHHVTCVYLCLGSLLASVSDLETTMASRGGLKRILSLLDTTGHLDKLKTAHRMTLFAPTDEALNRATLDPTELQNVLKYHMILDKAFDLHRNGSFGNMKLNSSIGLPIRINNYFASRVYSASGVRIIEKKIRVSNGYVHILDGIMTPPQGDVVDVLMANGALTSFASLISANGLENKLRSRPVTVFAPRDSAFAKLDTKIVEYLMGHPDDMSNCLHYHVAVKPVRYSIGMTSTISLQSLHQDHLNLMLFKDLSTGVIKVNNAEIVVRDIPATNGVVHIIDEVLIPAPTLVHMDDLGLTIG